MRVEAWVSGEWGPVRMGFQGFFCVFCVFEMANGSRIVRWVGTGFLISFLSPVVLLL